MVNELVAPIGGQSKFARYNELGQKITSEYMNNVRPQDAQEKRLRIGQRPGLDKWASTQIGAADKPVVFMVSVSTVV